MMAEDMVRLLDGCGGTREETVLRRFLARIHAWQQFMNRHRESVLSAENEQGLFGELVLLEHLFDAELPPQDILDAWQGPADGLQDFMLGSGGIEVKTTLMAGGFPATISSLEQLDDSLRKPLFVVATRLALHSGGMTLPERSMSSGKDSPTISKRSSRSRSDLCRPGFSTRRSVATRAGSGTCPVPCSTSRTTSRG